MRWDGSFHLLVDARINGQPVRLVVDTGGGSGVLDQAEMTRLGLHPVTRMKTGSYVPDADFKALSVGIGKIGAHKLHVTKVDILQNR
jgi:predicted aspartyl protease